MPYYTRKWQGRPYPRYPAPGPATGLRPLSRRPFETVLLAQDSQAGLSRRIVCAYGRQGAENWVADESSETLPGGGADPIWPQWSDERAVAHAKFFITPGHFLYAKVMFAPSGATASGSASNWDFDGARGRAIIDVTWTDLEGSTISQTYEVDLRGSLHLQDTTPEVPGGLPDGNSREWVDLPVANFPPIFPTDADRDVVDLRRWARAGTLVEVTLKVKGGARVEDWVVYEEPLGQAFKTDATDADPTPPGHVVNTTWLATQVRYPWEAQSDDLAASGEREHPQYGQHMMLDVHEAANRDLGPALIHWSAYHESTAATDDTEATVTTTSTSWDRLISGSTATAYDADEPGWDISCTGYARRWWLCDEYRVLPSHGVIPVRLQLRAKQTGGGTGTFRLQSGPDAYVEVEVTSGTMGWVAGRGYLRVPKNATGASNIQEFAKVTSGTLEVQGMSLVMDLV